MQPIPLWSVPFYDCQWEYHDVHAPALKKVCYDLEQAKRVSNIAVDAKRGLYESPFDFVSGPDPAVQAFRQWSESCFLEAVTHANQPHWKSGVRVSIDIHESWCHITRDGGFHDTHVHPDSSWSAIYYLDCGDMASTAKNGSNRFYNPNRNMYVDPGTTWMQASTSIDFLAEPGMMIIFPSWVQHSALVYRGQRDRIVIALNCKVREIPQ